MIKSITFKQDYRCFKAGDKLEFRRGLNLLVGDQGTGKTSLLEAMGGEYVPTYGSPQSMDELNKIRTLDMTCKSEPFRKFDFERDNPRTKGMNLDSFVSMQASFWSRSNSHGETVKAILGSMKESPKIKIWLLDEPDAALSIRSCRKLVQALQEVIETSRAQIIATVHNPHVIFAVEEVLSVEHRMWMSSREFVRRHLDEELAVAPAEEPKKRKKGAKK